MRTITRVFENYNAANRAVTDLEAAGVPSKNISLVANKYVSAKYDNVDEVSEAATGAGIGAVVGGTAGLLAGLGLMAIPGLGPVVAAGWLASTAVGAVTVGAAGGIIGALVDAGEPEEHAHVYSEAVRRGGTLLSAKVDDAMESRARAILDGFSPIDPVARGAEYRKSGWKQFDPAAEPYRPTDTELERIRRLS